MKIELLNNTQSPVKGFMEVDVTTIPVVPIQKKRGLVALSINH